MYRASIAMALALILSACAGPSMSPAPEDVPAASSDSDTAVRMAPDTQFASCRMITLTAEDLSAEYVPGKDPEMNTYRIIAEFPTNPHEMQMGLQGRANLHPETAMLLEFDGQHNPVLWMKDTPASLDMAFIDRKGDIFYLEAGTAPNSTRFLTPEEPDPVATHVLELPSGVAEELGIFPGLSSIKLGDTLPCASFRGPVITS